MPGSSDLFDSVSYTASSEYSSRNGERIDTLQIHHATMTSLSGLRSMMDPGGRTVSANGALGNDGHLMEVVPLSERAFTSASSFDRRCLTVECCNTSLSPDWGISEATRLRLARLAVDMFRAGLLGSLTRAHIIGHSEVPGTYATSCPGPDMHLDHIVELANDIHNGIAVTQEGDESMKYINVIGGGRGTVGELTFTPYTAETHGAAADTYAAVAGMFYDGEDVDQGSFDVLRQDALNRQAQLVAVIRQATGGNVGDIAAIIKAELRSAVEDALDGFTVDADISDEAASNIGQIAADRVIARIVSGLAS